MNTRSDNQRESVRGVNSHRQLTALVLEDDRALADVYRRLLDSLGYMVLLTHAVVDARAAIRAHAPDLMLVDIDLPDGNGLDLMDELRNDTRGRFVVITGDTSQRAIIKSIRHRAVELLLKPVDLKQLRLHLSSGHDKTDGLDETISTAAPCWIYHGDHPSLVALKTAMSLSAERSGGHSLIVGESGLDKPAVARELHHRGRRSGKLVTVDCQEVQDSAAVARFFGQEDPDTGAVLHRGYIEQAAAGTLVLDYIEHLSVDIQSRLLPLLVNGHFKRLNSMNGVQATVAVVGIARDKSTVDVDESPLRADLLFQLSQNLLKVPTLRHCRQDLPRIADFLLELSCADLPERFHFSDSSYGFIQGQSWPHNILELQSVIQAALTETQPGQAVDIRSGISIDREAPAEPDINAWVGFSIREMERELVLATLAHFDGGKEQTSRTLDISLKTLYNRLNSY